MHTEDKSLRNFLAKSIPQNNGKFYWWSIVVFKFFGTSHFQMKAFCGQFKEDQFSMLSVDKVEKLVKLNDILTYP